MGLFNSVKNFMGGDPPKITFSGLEHTIPVTDTIVKYRIHVAHDKPISVLNVVGKLIVYYTDEQNLETELEIGYDKDDGANWSASDNPFPGLIDAGKPWEFAGMVMMDDSKTKEFIKIFSNRSRYKPVLKLEVCPDVKGVFLDPTIKSDITVLTN